MARKINWRYYKNRPYDKRIDFPMTKVESAVMRTLAKNHFNRNISSSVRLLIGLKYIEDASNHISNVARVMNFKS